MPALFPPESLHFLVRRGPFAVRAASQSISHIQPSHSVFAWLFTQPPTNPFLSLYNWPTWTEGHVWGWVKTFFKKTAVSSKWTNRWNWTLVTDVYSEWIYVLSVLIMCRLVTVFPLQLASRNRVKRYWREYLPFSSITDLGWDDKKVDVFKLQFGTGDKR